MSGWLRDEAGTGVARPWRVRCAHETADFTVESIRLWWGHEGRERYRTADSLLVCADSGGSNSARSRRWKVRLQALADELRFPVTVCHLPPRTSKWNKIEHRLFAYISSHWRGRPWLITRRWSA